MFLSGRKSLYNTLESVLHSSGERLKDKALSILANSFLGDQLPPLIVIFVNTVSELTTNILK